MPPTPTPAPPQPHETQKARSQPGANAGARSATRDAASPGEVVADRVDRQAGIGAGRRDTRQGLDMSVVPRMSAEDVVTAGLRGLELGEAVCAPGVEDAGLLDAVFQADLAAFDGQSSALASRYRTN